MLLGSRKYFRLEHGMDKEDQIVFEDVSKRFKSNVWVHFKHNRYIETAKCNICSAWIKTKGGNTKGLHDHLKRHSIVAAKTVH